MPPARVVAAHVRRQLPSRAAWLTVALFALLAGGAFVTTLNAFLDQSDQVLSAAQPLNLNQLLVRPFLLQLGMAALLVLPLITAHTYAHRAPATSNQTVFATFVGTLTVYVVMLLASAALIAVLFAFGSPEWGSILSGYLGLLLIGAALVAAALVVSSLSHGATAAALITGALALLLIAAMLVADSGPPVVDAGIGRPPAFTSSHQKPRPRFARSTRR